MPTASSEYIAKSSGSAIRNMSEGDTYRHSVCKDASTYESPTTMGVNSRLHSDDIGCVMYYKKKRLASQPISSIY